LETPPYTNQVEILYVTNTSVKVRLQEVRWPDWCTDMSHPSVKYTVYFKADVNQHDDCRSQKDSCVMQVIQNLCLTFLSTYKVLVMWMQKTCHTYVKFLISSMLDILKK